MDARLRTLADHLLPKSDAAAVDPRSIDAELQPYLYIVDVERVDHIRLRIRHIGTALDGCSKDP